MVTHCMEGVLNEYTETVHKQQSGQPHLHTECVEPRTISRLTNYG
jgi:hypothetical protein